MAISSTCNKVITTCGLLQRNFKDCFSQIKSCAYNSYVRPIVKTVVWSPYTEDDMSRIEMMQPKAAKFVFNDFKLHYSVTSMLDKLN